MTKSAIFFVYAARIGRIFSGDASGIYLPDQPTEALRKSLNPLTKYRLKGMESVLSNKIKWNFYDAAKTVIFKGGTS